MHKLGHGSFGSVSRTDKGHAKKEYYVDCQEAALREITILQMISSPHVVDYVEHMYTPQEQSVTMKCALGTLESLIESDVQYGETFCSRAAHSIVSAVAHIHKLGIIHRDIKPDNVFIFPDQTTKLADFSLAKFEAESDCHTPRCGTRHYFSPEMATCCYNQRTDDYSTGLTLLELFTAWAESTDPDNIEEATLGLREYSNGWYTMVRGLIEKDLEKRASCVAMCTDDTTATSVTTCLPPPVEQNSEVEAILDNLDVDDRYYEHLTRVYNYYRQITKSSMTEVIVCAACVVMGHCTAELDACFTVFKRPIISLIKEVQETSPLAIYMCRRQDSPWTTQRIAERPSDMYTGYSSSEEGSSTSSKLSTNSDDKSSDYSDREEETPRVEWETVITDIACKRLKQARTSIVERCTSKLVPA